MEHDPFPLINPQGTAKNTATKNPTAWQEQTRQSKATCLFLEPDGSLVGVVDVVEQIQAAGAQPPLEVAPLGSEQGDAREQEGIEGEVSRDWLVGAGGKEEAHGDRDDGGDDGVDPGVTRGQPPQNALLWWQTWLGSNCEERSLDTNNRKHTCMSKWSRHKI